MAESEISSLNITTLKDKLQFLEVHEGLMKDMLAIEDSKFTLHSHLFSSSILASINRHCNAVTKGGEDTETLEKVTETMGKLKEVEQRITEAEVKLKAKMKVYEEKE